MKTFHCNRCDNLVFFENVRCERCEARLGYVPELGEISAFEPAEAAAPIEPSEPIEPAAPVVAPAPIPGTVAAAAPQTSSAPAPQAPLASAPDTSLPPLSNPSPPPAPETSPPPALATSPAPALWRSLHPAAAGRLFQQCHNYAVENVCNWMVPADAPLPAAPGVGRLCRACQLTHTIPNLSNPENHLRWYRLEAAKRRLLYTLSELELAIPSRLDDPEHGVTFEFLEDNAAAPVMTGHDNGRITVNIAEADDAKREQARAAMHEPYRTLLGHFRHEIGHYYFDQLIADNPRWLEPFRAAFGDERADYGAALDAHYQHGAPADWPDHYISAYATTHPWEDWAETWAHYLHIIDTLDTATSCGLALVPESRSEPTLTDQTPVDEASFDNLMKRWFPLTYALNSLNRSLGQPDGYPFALAAPVVEKLRFVHRVIVGQKSAQAAASAALEKR